MIDDDSNVSQKSRMSVFDQPSHQPWCLFQLCNHGISMNEHRPMIHRKQEVYVQPQDKKDKEELDALLSQAMNELTFEERQEQQEILHGVHQVIEDDDFIARALQDLDHHLSTNVHVVGSAYEVAERMDPGYVLDKDFRLMFLRANEYDPKSTGDHILRFFDLKLQLFGKGKLTKDITMRDLDESEIACLQRGAFQLAGRDRSGRQIFITVGGLVGRTEIITMQNYQRALFFIKMRAFRSKETQIRGTVAIWYSIGDMKNKSNGQGYLESFKTGRALPQKTSAIHICVDDIHQALLCNALLKIMPRNMRARVKLHCGSHTECQYRLSTYGIPPQSLPFDTNGRMSFDRHLHWIHCCAMEDNVLMQMSLVAQSDVPGPNDVLFACGNIRNHEGTVGFRDVVEKYSKEYDSGTHESKRELVDEIIERIHETGGRFLRETRDSASLWEDVPQTQVRKKIMQTFRNRRRRGDAPKQANVWSSGTLIADDPLPNDVIFGKKNQNPGTEMMFRLIKHHFQEYESLERGAKIKLVETLMQNITSQGSRFLKPAEKPGKWLELSSDSVRDRISKSFRNQRRYIHRF